MDDIIYILLGILWLVFTFYTQSRKQKKKRELAQQKHQQQAKKEVQREKPKTIFEELFQEELAVDEPEPAFEEPSVLPEEKQPSKIKTFEDIYSSRGIQSVEVSRGKYYGEGQKEEKDKQKKVPESEISLHEEERESIDFDLRKAVIYAEILRRPYA